MTLTNLERKSKTMTYEFDDFNKGIVSERQKARRNLDGFLMGDYILRPDGLKARISHVWDDGVQTTKFSECGNAGSFHLNRSGDMSYSGGLEPTLKATHLKHVNNSSTPANCWIFHHGQSGAHRGVDCEVLVQSWVILDDCEAVNPDIEGRYILKEGEFKGWSQSSTYTTFDGVERVHYRDGQTLDVYLRENKDCYVVDSAHLDECLERHNNSLKTKPKECSKSHYWDMLECLPPERWHKVGGASVFHISERETQDLVQWLIELNDKYYSFIEEATISDEDLAVLISNID